MYLKIFQKSLPVLLIISILAISGCATYYGNNIAFQQAYENSDYDGAEKILHKKARKEEKGRNRLLYWLNAGTIAHMLGKYDESNVIFEKAYIYCEDEAKLKIGSEALAMVTNPMAAPYKIEDVEILLINYYKALNYLALGNNENALVEARRMYQRELQLSDKYTSEKRMKRDAFIQVLMGLIFETNNDPSSAFVCYRNAHDIYKEDYSKFFNFTFPQQLKIDLLRMAKRNGTNDFLTFYENEFGMKYSSVMEPRGPEAILLWNNGLGPYKDEWSINFTIVRGQGGMVTFNNEEYNMSFPFYLPAGGQGNGNLSDLSFVRVTLPKYMERPNYYTNAQADNNGAKVQFSKLEDINAVSFKFLKDKQLEILSKELIRVATKKLEEEMLRNQNQYAGAALGIFNALTEKADTRNWQTVPHDVSYARVPLTDNKTSIVISLDGNGSSKQVTLNIKPNQKKSFIMPFFTLQALK